MVDVQDHVHLAVLHHAPAHVTAVALQIVLHLVEVPVHQVAQHHVAADVLNHVVVAVTPIAPKHVVVTVTPIVQKHVEPVAQQDAPNRVVLVVLLGVKGAALWLVQAIAQAIVILLVQEDVKVNAGQHVEVLAMKNALVVHGVANMSLMERAVGAKPTVLVCAVQHANTYVITSL